MFFPKTYQPRETLFDNLDSFNIPYSDDQKLFDNMAIFHFESICVQEDKFRDTDTATWIGKHVPISVSISSNLSEQPIFLCDSNPGALVESFVDALDGLATQSKARIEPKFLSETNVKSKHNQIFSAFIQRRRRKEPVLEFEDECIEEEEKQDVSTQFLQTQKNQLIDLQAHLERYCNVLRVFGFKSAK